MDLLDVAETHLRGHESLHIDGYTWIGHNRESLHVNARRGSGGVGLFVRISVYDFLKVSLLNNDTEDMLWIKMTSICVPILTFCICISYLPPENSSRYVCAETFFDILLGKVYMYRHEGMVIICGDLKGRIGSHSDYIEGVDKIPERSVLDY